MFLFMVFVNTMGPSARHIYISARVLPPSELPAAVSPLVISYSLLPTMKQTIGINALHIVDINIYKFEAITRYWPFRTTDLILFLQII